MSFRPLEIAGRFANPPDGTITFDGHEFAARSGEPLTVTLLAHGVHVLGRSSKYHRSRGYCCGRGACGNCLAQVDGLPNQRLCMCNAKPGRVVQAQNTLGTANFDLLSAIDWVFAGGFDHHHFMTESATLNRMAVSMAHKLAGLGKLPEAPVQAALQAPDERRVDAVVVGAGKAGRAAARALSAAGCQVLVLEAMSQAGEAAASAPAVTSDCCVLGLYDDRVLIAVSGGRELRVSATAIVLATGAYEQLPPCTGNDVPGVFLMRAVRLAVDHGVLPGRQVVLAVDAKANAAQEAEAAELGEALIAGGAEVVLAVGPARIAGARRHAVGMIESIDGSPAVRRVRVTGVAEPVDCDALVWCGRRTPAYELPRQMGLETPFVPTLGAFVPRCDEQGATGRPGIFVAGELTGKSSDAAAAHGAHVGAAAASYVLARRARASASEVVPS